MATPALVVAIAIQIGVNFSNDYSDFKRGADAERVGYAMPRGLPPLDPKRMPDPKARDTKEAKMATFMTEEVTPAMADLLGMPRLEAGNTQGFPTLPRHLPTLPVSYSVSYSAGQSRGNLPCP